MKEACLKEVQVFLDAPLRIPAVSASTAAHILPPQISEEIYFGLSLTLTNAAA